MKKHRSGKFRCVALLHFCQCHLVIDNVINSYRGNSKYLVVSFNSYFLFVSGFDLKQNSLRKLSTKAEDKLSNINGIQNVGLGTFGDLMISIKMGKIYSGCKRYDSIKWQWNAFKFFSGIQCRKTTTSMLTQKYVHFIFI